MAGQGDGAVLTAGRCVRRRGGLRAALAGLAVALAASTAAAASDAPAASGSLKFALVIGEARYAHAAPLANPLNDAQAVDERLRGMGFRTTMVLNGGLSELRQGLHRFIGQLPPDALALVHFSGHAIQMASRNHLLPVDVKASRAEEAVSGSLALDDITRALSKRAPRFTVLVLDACRNTPFSAQVRPGLAEMTGMPTNTLLVFAAAPGQVASDGHGLHGLFTEHLLRHMDRPGVAIDQMLRRVRAAVAEESMHTQIPWDNSALTQSLSLADFPVLVQPRAVDPRSAAGVDHATEEELLDLLATPQDQALATLARRRLSELRAGSELHRQALRLRSVRPCEDCPPLSPSTATGPLDASPHWISTYPVTVGDYRRCVRARVCDAPPGLAIEGADPALPLTHVSYAMALRYVAWLNRRPARFSYRLPSMQEWMEAYREGYFDQGQPFFGSNLSACRVANLYDLSAQAEHALGLAPLPCHDGFPDLAPVGSFLPSRLGVFDQLGSVWQWTSSCVGSDSPGTTAACPQRQLVGGSWATRGSSFSWEHPPRATAPEEALSATIGLRLFASPR